MEIRTYNGHEIHPGSPVYERLVKQEKFVPYTEQELDEYAGGSAQEDELDGLSKADLVARAEELGVPHTGTKPELVEAIRSAEGETL